MRDFTKKSFKLFYDNSVTVKYAENLHIQKFFCLSFL